MVHFTEKCHFSFVLNFDIHLLEQNDAFAALAPVSRINQTTYTNDQIFSYCKINS